MKKEQDKQPEKKKEFWYWVFWIIIVFVILSFLNNSSKVDDYNYCVDDCIYHLNNCMDYPSFFSDAYIKESVVSKCLNDLESYALGCEINYGN